MTPEEIAKRIVGSRFYGAPYMSAYTAPDLVADIATAIRDAYERAAVAVEDCDAIGHAARQIAAARVRALKGTSPEVHE